MNEVIEIISGTPLYVWGILFYLLYVGIKNTKRSVIHLPKLFIIPLVLLAIKYESLFSGDFLFTFVAILMGALVGILRYSYYKIKIIEKEKSVEIPGNYEILIILISFFLLKYFFGYLQQENILTYMRYYKIDYFISGLFSGYLFGRALYFTYRYISLLKKKTEF